MYVVEIGLEESASKEKENEFCHQHLLLFLYTIYSNFLPAKNLIETFIGPRDEKNILQLALSQSKFDAEPSSDIMDLIWIEASKQRLFGIQEGDKCLIEAIEQILKSNNIIDRVYLVNKIKNEYFVNAELINALHSAEYIVVSNQLTWFEHLVVSLLIEMQVPNIRFSKTPDLKPFLSLQQCSVVHEHFIEPEPISRSFLAYLAVAVNIKNTFDLALVINKPFRGFSRSFFSTLRRISSNASMLPGQLVLSYPACMTASAATSTLRIADAKLLKTSIFSLEHLANTIRTCQDALSGFLDDDASLASSSQFGSMSTEAAADAVRACFTVTQRAFTRPPRINKDPEKIWSVNDIKTAKRALNERLEELISSPLVEGCENLISSTPNRPVYAGGSLQGRPAYRLARLFLVYEATRQVAPPRRPDTSTMTTQCTPIGHRTFNAFFESPAPQDRSPQVTKATPTNALNKNGNTALKGEKSPEQAPKRRLHTRYQSNLEWATESQDSPSSVVVGFTLVDEDDNARMELPSIEDSCSVFVTPKKKPKTLFEELEEEEGESKENAHFALSTKTAPIKETKPSQPKASKSKAVKPRKSKVAPKVQLKNQPSILGYFNPKSS